jgi:hypothetical protein
VTKSTFRKKNPNIFYCSECSNWAILIFSFIMPKRSRRSERAKLQRASGKPGFDSGFVEDAFDKLQDPDFELDLDINDQEDSDEEILVFNFSVADEGIKTDSDTDESESETDGLDEFGEEDYEDQVVIKSIGELEEHIERVSYGFSGNI